MTQLIYAINAIEKFWANMKRWIKNQFIQVDQLYNIIGTFFSLC
ncbi:MAG: hypothetical protein RCG15_07920 [Candidatus Rickettsia vulgarisii]